jgi:predicted ATPase
MKFKLENLGLLDDAEIEISDLTIICGDNNTGKTYATYAVYGFLRVWRRLLQMSLQGELHKFLTTDGSYRINLAEMFSGKVNEYLRKMGRNYIEALPTAFATSAEFFSQSVVLPEIDETFDIAEKRFQRSIKAGTSGKVIATLSKEAGSLNLDVLVGDDSFSHSSFGGIEEFVADAIAEIVFAPYLPQAHISSAERTGATIFRKELDFARTRMIEALGKLKPSELKNPIRLLRQMEAGYSWPVQDNVDFVRQLEDLEKQQSELSATSPDILRFFDAMIGGTYKIVKNQGLIYQPKGANKTRFTMAESSSSIRALLDVGFYLRCKAKPGDLFIIDEPELNLHPRNQRAFARLVARLVNAGIKVFITTHSDYLIKEINTLIMLNRRSPHTKLVQKMYHYDDTELLDPSCVRLYMTGTALKRVNKEDKRSTRINTLTLAKIHDDAGIEVGTFDTTIEEMNTVQSEILYGGEL